MSERGRIALVSSWNATRGHLGIRRPWVETHGYHHKVATRRIEPAVPASFLESLIQRLYQPVLGNGLSNKELIPMVLNSLASYSPPEEDGLAELLPGATATVPRSQPS